MQALRSCSEDLTIFLLREQGIYLVDVRLNLSLERTGTGGLSQQQAIGIQRQNQRREADLPSLATGQSCRVACTINDDQGRHPLRKAEGDLLTDVASHRMTKKR